MSTDATTLYKLMVLYMLDKVNFPLSNSQIADFMLDRQYTNYFTLQEVLSSLASDGFVQILTYRSSTQYKLTKEGIDTISFFYNKISQAIRDDIDKYLKDNKYDYDDSYLQEGFTDYIIKSSDKEEMLNKINKYLK